MDKLDDAFFALSDPTRRAIVTRLIRGEATLTQLAQPFQMTQPAISRHLRVLERARLITRRIQGTRRPCRLDARGIEAIERWLTMTNKAIGRNSHGRLNPVPSGVGRPKRKGAQR